MKYLTLIAFFFLVSTSYAQTTQTEHHISKKVTQEVLVDYQYLLHIPNDQSNAEEGKFPLLVFLHGAGERGTDIELLKVHGPPMLVAKGQDLPFIVLSPQCLENVRWDAVSLKLLIDDIVATHSVDKSRIYLTGLSMGGYGTWDLAINYPDYFAAIAPICGGSDTHAWDAPGRINDLPIWAFHGAMDYVVPVERTINIIASLRRAGATPKMTIYPYANHNSWTETYDNPKLYEWFLEHRRE